MKKTLLTLIAILFAFQVVHAQWTNVSGTGNYYLNSGNVGIGTASPSGALSLGTSVINKKILIYDSGTEASGFGQANSELRIFGASSGINHLSFGKYTLTSDTFLEQMRIDNSGNVGIGTTSPGALLDVNGTFRGVADNTYLGFDADTDRFGFVKKYGLFGQLAYGSAATFTISQSSGTTIASGNTFIPRFTIDNSGNVGINTTNIYGYQLAINGTAIATSMTVKAYANWPDYVLKKNYPLPSLIEVKTYIDQNHHLPEIPSEKEIAKDGLNLGEMNKLLIKKVEELTLYLIEIDKQIKEQNEKLIQLEKRMEKLETAKKNNQ
jgi:hypothetical protein